MYVVGTPPKHRPGKKFITHSTLVIPTTMAPKQSSRAEIQQSKSPAEFFAENQAIAGFDNPGKSLYTTIRELVENSLDACESVDVLPDISVDITEMTERMFNELRGVPDDNDKKPSSAGNDADDTGGKNNKKRTNKFDAYFQITVRDNGCGMAHKAIPDLLGRVLSGSKYGVRQTRGKFGLGAFSFHSVCAPCGFYMSIITHL